MKGVVIGIVLALVLVCAFSTLTKDLEAQMQDHETIDTLAETGKEQAVAIGKQADAIKVQAESNASAFDQITDANDGATRQIKSLTQITYTLACALGLVIFGGFLLVLKKGATA